MPILTRLTNFCDFHDFRKAAFLGISKISTVNFEINSISFYLFQKFLLSSGTNLCTEKLNSGSNLKDFSAML